MAATAAAIGRSASGWISHSLFCRNTGFTPCLRCQRGFAGDGVRSRYQPPPALFLFDRWPFPAALATSRWSLNPAPHGSGNSAAMITPKGRLCMPSRAWRHETRCCCSRSTGCCCCGSTTAGCCRCCSRSPRAARGKSRNFSRGMPRPLSATQHRRPQAPTVRMAHMADP